MKIDNQEYEEIFYQDAHIGVCLREGVIQIVENGKSRYYKKIKPDFLENIKSKIDEFIKKGIEPAIIILNEEDMEDIKNSCMINKEEFLTTESLLGVKVLLIPNYLRDNTFLNEGCALIISQGGLKDLKESLLHAYD